MTELFETFDDAGRPLGLVPRDEVHARGLWHRAAHVLLFTGDGRLYVQRRADTKDICPGRWDLSVGEHLTPGESFEAGAHRGLAEELGVTDVALTPLAGVRSNRLDLPERGIRDHELQQAFRGVYDGPVTVDPTEVAAVDALSLADIEAWIAREPEAFTPWFLADLRTLELIDV